MKYRMLDLIQVYWRKHTLYSESLVVTYACMHDLIHLHQDQGPRTRSNQTNRNISSAFDFYYKSALHSWLIGHDPFICLTCARAGLTLKYSNMLVWTKQEVRIEQDQPLNLIDHPVSWYIPGKPCMVYPRILPPSSPCNIKRNTPKRINKVIQSKVLHYG